MNDLIYLDNNATTKIDPRVLDAMMPFLTDEYANASSKHEFGTTVNEAVKKARRSVAELIGAETNEIIFTAGATEAINLSIKGVAEAYVHKGNHIITVQTEHSAVLDVCKYLETRGFEIDYLPVKKDGLLNLDVLKKVLRTDTILVSVMFVNNEIGVIQPIEEIIDIVHANGSLVMSDATQAVGKLPIDAKDLGIDLMSFSGHKFYGPKGIGGLYVNNKINIKPLIHGGGQERGIRSGTLNVPGIVGLGKACEIAKNDMEDDINRIKELRDHLEEELLKIGDTFVNGNRERRLYNVTNICFKNNDIDTLMTRLTNIAVSNASACNASSIEPSHVLKALGLSDKESFASLRFSLGKYNNREEVNYTLNRINILLAENTKLIQTLE
jgi:cysteine desulfurase